MSVLAKCRGSVLFKVRFQTMRVIFVGPRGFDKVEVLSLSCILPFITSGLRSLIDRRTLKNEERKKEKLLRLETSGHKLRGTH